MSPNYECHKFIATILNIKEEQDLFSIQTECGTVSTSQPRGKYRDVAHALKGEQVVVHTRTRKADGKVFLFAIYEIA